MAVAAILWLVFFFMNMILLVMNVYQYMCLSDLEADYLNPYESSSHINKMVIPEFVLHGAFCVLFLVTGHWLMFFITAIPAYYNLRKFLAGQHLVDVTEAFRLLEAEKKFRAMKLCFYLVLFVIVLIRAVRSVPTILSVSNSSNGGFDIRSSMLEF